MNSVRRNQILHLSICLSLYIFLAALDVYFTLKGIEGDISIEGNPAIRYMMGSFGMAGGLIVEKGLVLSLSLIVALVAFNGIEKEYDWVYYLAFTRLTRNWMKRKKRYWVAFVPVYFVALSQGVAALSWLYLLSSNGDSL